MRYQTCEFERAHRVHLRIYQVYTKNEFAFNSKAISKNINLDELTLTREFNNHAYITTIRLDF